MLMAWNTGHRGGLCTIHADSSRDTLVRIEEMLATGSGAASATPRAQIARAIHVIVFIETTRDRAKYPAGRFIGDIVRVDGIDSDNRYQLTRVD
jgi:Flp pilus assembly CpaF family ATPase